MKISLGSVDITSNAGENVGLLIEPCGSGCVGVVGESRAGTEVVNGNIKTERLMDEDMWSGGVYTLTIDGDSILGVGNASERFAVCIEEAEIDDGSNISTDGSSVW